MASKYESFKVFYNNLALLHQVANKQTMFLAYLLAEMDDDNIIHMTKYRKEKIANAIGLTAVAPDLMIRQLLHKLCKTDLLISLGGGAYKVNPKFSSRYKDQQYVIDKREQEFVELRMKQGKGKDSVVMEIKEEYK